MALRKRAGWTRLESLAWLTLALPGAMMAQYSTPVGKGAAKPKTLRATTVLEWTGSIEKPTASRLMPIAVWDGEHYQPAGLYLAQPAPLAFATDTQYVLEQGGEEKGLFDVREATRVHGDWIGRGRFLAQAPSPPPPKLKVSKTLPVLTNGKEKPEAASASDQTKAGGQGTNGSAGGSSGDDDKPTLHRRTADDTSDAPPAPSGSGTAGSAPAQTHPAAGSASEDPDQPTLHRRSAGSSGDASSADDDDPDRPTLHRATERSSPNAAGTASIDPDRPHLRYGSPAEEDNKLPPALLGLPAGMHQLVGVSDVAKVEPQSYMYRWSNTEDPAKVEATLAGLAAKAAAGGPAAAGLGSSTASNAGARSGPRATHVRRIPPAPALVDAHFTAFELSFSGGPTLVYSAHTDAPEAQRIYVTLIAQPDFSGQPQVLLQQVSRGDRLDEKPAMQLVDAVDTDGDQRAELIFQLMGNSPALQGTQAKGQFAAADPETSAEAANAAVGAGQAPRQFAIYRVAGGKAEQVFTTGPLP